MSSFGATVSNPLKAKNAHEILITYAECSSFGNTEYNKYLFTEDFQYENVSNNSKVGKKEYLRFLKENKGLNYDCKTRSEILDLTNDTAVAKTTYTFSNFTRVDFVTLSQTKEGWKISKVITSYL